MKTTEFFRFGGAAATLAACAMSVALPPQRLAAASSASTLTVRKDVGSTATTSGITEAVEVEEESLYGKPIKAKLSVSRVGDQGLDVPGASARSGDYLLQNERVSF